MWYAQKLLKERHSTIRLSIARLLRGVLGRARVPSPSGYEELSLRCLLPYLGVKIHGEEGAGTVEDGGQGAHERSQHDRQHQASQSWGQREQSLVRVDAMVYE